MNMKHNKNNAKKRAAKKNAPPQQGPNLLLLLVVVSVVWLIVNFFAQIGTNGIPKEMTYSQIYQKLQSDAPPPIVSVVKKEGFITGKLADGSAFYANIEPDDKELLKLMREKGVEIVIKPPQTFLSMLFYYFGPVLVLVLFYWFFMFRGNQMGGRILSFGKARARSGPKDKVTFDDVAGVDEAKEELKEVIDFVKDPKKYQRLGGKIPKGVLLVGPPGTGKTLLAKAVAGEADVPFFSISGSDFVEMFVGVGAARVRDLFDQAKKASQANNKGCIIYIDEIDAVGGKRSAMMQGAHEERQQTLNQLLVELDGFDTSRGIIVMASTNRPDVLDPALLRPGRFDRRIVVDLPDMNGRESILKVHAKNVKIGKEVNFKRLAQQTPGFSGADLANLINEAALLAARRNKSSVTMEELEESIERVMAGPQRRSRVINKKEKEIVAYHESGHALMSLLLKDVVDPLHKVSIVPRGVAALGYTLQRPTEDRYLITKAQLLGRINVLLGGRVAEKIIFNEVSTGAHNDLEVATTIAHRMVCEFGMSDRLGAVVWEFKGQRMFWDDMFVDRNYSSNTAREIDEEVKKIIDEAYDNTMDLLSKNKDKLSKLAQELLKKETLSVVQVKKLLGMEENEDNGPEETEDQIDPPKQDQQSGRS